MHIIPACGRKSHATTPPNPPHPTRLTRTRPRVPLTSRHAHPRGPAQDKIDKVLKIATTAKAKVEALDKDNEAAKKKKGQGAGTASERTRTTITAGLKKKLKDLMQEFSELRTRITSEYREVVERRVYTVTGEGVSSSVGLVVARRTMHGLHQQGRAEKRFAKRTCIWPFTLQEHWGWRREV